MLKKIMIIVMLAVCGATAGYGGEARKVEQALLGADGIQRVKVVGGSYFFTPGHIIVKVDVPVELSVSRESGMVPHDIVVKAPEAGINFSESMSTDPKIIRFTPTKPGVYPVYCSKKLLFLESHREKGMEGVLEVLK
jgi:plastocyanin domain-containing protein